MVVQDVMKILVKSKYKGCNAAFTTVAFESHKAKPILNEFLKQENNKLELQKALEKIPELWKNS